MPGVIDSMVIAVGLDSSQYQKGKREVQEDLKRTREDMQSSAKRMEESGKVAAQFFSKLRQEALSFFAVMLGGRSIAQFASEAVAGLSAMGRAAQDIGVSAQTLSAFEHVVERAGGSAEGAAGALRSVRYQLDELRATGNTGNLRFLNQIGATGANSPLEVIEKFQQWARQVDRGQANLVGRALFGDQATVDVLLNIRDLNEQLDRAKRLGTPDQAQIKAMQDLQGAWSDFRYAMDQAANTIFASIAPALTEILKWLTGLVAEFNDFLKHHHEWAMAIGIVTAALVGLLGVMTLLAAFRLPLMLIGLIARLSGLVALLRSVGIIGAATDAAPAVAAGAGGGAAADAAAGGALVAGGRLATSAATEGALGTAARFAGPVGAAAYAMRPTAITGGMSQERDLQMRNFYELQRKAIYDAAVKRGLPHPDVIAAIGAAQSSLETGGGSHGVGNNYFGIKAHGNDPSVEAMTWEVINGQRVRVPQRFKKYGSREESAVDYVDFLMRNPRYKAMLQAGTIQGGLAGLHGYATDPTYESKLYSIQQRYGQPQQQPVSNDNSSEVHIGQVTVQTQATDAHGIARDMHGAIRRRATVAQANSGLS